MVLTKSAGKPPRAIAEALVARSPASDVVARGGDRGPRLREPARPPGVFHDELAEILAAGQRLRPRAARRPASASNLEFVSANPTGPIIVASGRNAIFGDAVARLSRRPATASRASTTSTTSATRCASSPRASAPSPPGASAPEEGYKGALRRRARAAWLKKVDAARRSTGDVEALARRASRGCSAASRARGRCPGIRPTPRRPRRRLRRVVQRGVAPPLGRGRRRSCASSRRAATSSRRTARSSSRRPDGGGRRQGPRRPEDRRRLTRTSRRDIAYLADKIARGYDRLIDVLGADHHGYVAARAQRARGARPAAGALRGAPLPARLHHAGRRGREDAASAPATSSPIDEVIDEIDEAAGRKGAGATRSASSSSRAARTRTSSSTSISRRRSSLDNPVFYVQYGHARLARSCARRARSASSLPSEPSRAGRVGDARAPRRARPRATGSATFPTSSRRPRASASRTASSSTCRSSRATSRATSRASRRDDPILPPAALRRGRWETRGTSRRRARASRGSRPSASVRAALGLLGVSAPERMDWPPEEPVESSIEEN